MEEFDIALENASLAHVAASRHESYTDEWFAASALFWLYAAQIDTLTARPDRVAEDIARVHARLRRDLCV